MNERELYKQKKQAQLDQWKAELFKLKAKASEASADTKLKMNSQIKGLESKVEEGKTRLSAIEDAGEEEWKTVKEGLESAWDSMKSAFSDAADKFRE